jgi:hypothetical protein
MSWNGPQIVYTNKKPKTKPDKSKQILVGIVPYEDIVEIDWVGFIFSKQPRIYCHFDSKGNEPFLEVEYWPESELDEFWYSDWPESEIT